jgi:hypothetical protein
MKHIIIILFCLFYSLFAFAQINDTNIYIEGYVVFVKNKKDVLLAMQQEKNKECFEANIINRYKHTVYDFRYQVKYITTKCEIEKWHLVDSTEILEIITQSKNYEFYNFFYSLYTDTDDFKYNYNNQLETFIKKNNINIPTNIVDSINFNTFSNNDCKYYTDNNDTTNVYQFYYLKGYVVRHLVFNDYLNSKQIFSNRLNSFYVQRSIPAFFVYIWYEINDITCNTQPSFFIEWKPELK